MNYSIVQYLLELKLKIHRRSRTTATMSQYIFGNI